MRYKDNWPETRDRLSALWNGKPLDRCCLCVTAPSQHVVESPTPTNLEQKWIGPDHICRLATATLAGRWWGGESIPSYLLMCGWVVCYGGEPRFAENTIWYAHKDFDLDRPPDLRFDPDNPWTQKHTACRDALVELAGKDDFLVGTPCILPANDILSMQMNTDSFLMTLIDHPEWMGQAIIQGACANMDAIRFYRERLAGKHDYWYGIGGWMPFWAPEPFYATQSDVSCMISPEMFEAFIVPELDIYGLEFGAVWYHLDGRNACQHLPRLLSLPYIRVIQYVPSPDEPENGPDHMDLYRTIQEAGRIVHIQVPPQHVIPLAKGLDRQRLMLQTEVSSRKEGEALLAQLKNLD